MQRCDRPVIPRPAALTCWWLQYMVQDPDAVFKKLQDDFHGGEEIPELTPELREHLVRNVRRRMTPQPLKIRADVELTCFAYDGVLHIQVQFISRVLIRSWCWPLEQDSMG